MKNKTLIITLYVCVALLCVIIIGGTVVLYFTNKDSTSSEDVASTDVEEGQFDIYDEQEYVDESFFADKEKYNFELIYQKELQLVNIEPEYDPESNVPSYQQMLVSDASRLQGTLDQVIAQIQDGQNYSADVWSLSSEAGNGYYVERDFTCILSTEIHFYHCIATKMEKTAEDCAEVRVYKKVEVPTYEEATATNN